MENLSQSIINVSKDIIENINRMDNLIYDDMLKELGNEFSVFSDKFINFLNDLKKVGIEPDEELNSTLNGLYQAFESRDYVLTADILNYELKPMLEAFIKAIQEWGQLQ